MDLNDDMDWTSSRRFWTVAPLDSSSDEGWGVYDGKNQTYVVHSIPMEEAGMLADSLEEELNSARRDEERERWERTLGIVALAVIVVVSILVTFD